MIPISLIDEIQFKTEFRAFVKREGFNTALQAFYEMLLCSQFVAEILNEELKNGNIKSKM